MLLLRQAVAVTAVGVVAGMWAAFALTRYVSSFLYGIGRVDLVSYASVGAAITAVAAIACVVPARRAARIDPLIVLRSQ